MQGAADNVRLGLLLVTLSAIAYSTAGYFTRLIELDVWTILVWRGLFAGLAIAAFIAVTDARGLPGAFRDLDAAGLGIAVCSTLATVAYLNALRQTTVGDVMVIAATVPFVTAALAWLWHCERADRVTLLAAVVALAGVLTMTPDAVGEGRLFGVCLAMLMTVMLAIMMLLIRSRHEVSMLPAVALSAFLCSVVAAPFAATEVPRNATLVYLVLFGVMQFGLGLLLLTIGTRMISATRSALLNCLDVPLAPIWVWLAFSEVPAMATLLGGLLVTAAVVADVVAPRQQA